MIARKREIRLQLNQLVDAVLLGVVFWCCHALRYYKLIVWDTVPEISSFNYFIWMLAVIMPFAPFLLELEGFYATSLAKPLWKSLEQIARAGFWLGLLIGGSVIFLRLEVPSRSVLLLFLLMAPCALLIKERIFIWNYTSRLKHGASGEDIILAGEADKMREIFDSFSPEQKLEVRVVALVNLEKDGMDALVEALHHYNVGRVVLAFSRMEMDTVQRAIEICETEGVEAWLSADFVRTAVAKPTYELLGMRPMLVFRATPEISWSVLTKGVIDRVAAFLGILLLLPALFLVALLVKLSSHGPAIFTQRRAGIHGKPFKMLKFRTMYSDAEKRHEELVSLNEMSGPVFKVENDPRVTPIGRWLRRTSIDELPQLVNVLFGDMSLVGPRPLPLYEVAKFQDTAHRRRLSMKPGLTCLWQIRGRNNVTNFEQWVKMDLEYIDNWSLGLDFIILIRTIPAVLMGFGAK